MNFKLRDLLHDYVVLYMVYLNVRVENKQIIAYTKAHTNKIPYNKKR